jgi:hypothetical protein
MNKTALLFLALLFGARLAMAQDVKNSNYPFFAQGEIPLYPTVAKTARLSGNVKVQVTVRDGSIVAYDLRRSVTRLSDSRQHQDLAVLQRDQYDLHNHFYVSVGEGGNAGTVQSENRAGLAGLGQDYS